MKPLRAPDIASQVHDLAHRVHARARRSPRPRAAVADDALARVASVGSPFAAFSRGEDCAPSVSYRSDVQEGTFNATEYAALSKRWHVVASRDLRDVTFDVAGVSRLAKNELLVQWSTSFVPAKLTWLYDLGLNWPLGALKMSKYDILDRAGETSTFSWRVLAQVFKRAVFEKEMRIPIAKIEGTSAMTFDDEGRLMRHVESLVLVSMVNAGKVRNKRVMRDVLEYLDCRKPPGVSLEDWDINIESKIDVYSVPGMRQLDVDGLEDQRSNVEDATAVLGFFTLVLLTFSSVGFAWYMRGLQSEKMFREMLDTGAF